MYTEINVHKCLMYKGMCTHMQFLKFKHSYYTSLVTNCLCLFIELTDLEKEFFQFKSIHKPTKHQKYQLYKMIISPHLSLGYKLVFPQSQLALVHCEESLLLHTSCYSLFGFLLAKSSVNIKN